MQVTFGYLLVLFGLRDRTLTRQTIHLSSGVEQGEDVHDERQNQKLRFRCALRSFPLLMVWKDVLQP